MAIHSGKASGAVLILVLLLGNPDSLRGEEIVLGTSAAFKGPSQGLGIELYRGAMAYLEEVNRKGGVHGRRIVIKAYDDNYNPLPAIANTIQLIEKDRPLLLFNYVGTPTVTRCLPLLQKHRDQSMLLFFPFTGAQPQRQEPYGEFVFNLRASYYQEAAGLVDHFVAIGRKRIGVLYQIDAYGRNGWEGVRSALGRHGLKMTAEATYRRGTAYSSSLKEQVEILRQSGSDAIICVGAYAACAAFVRDARDAGWDIPIANVSFVGSENLLALLMETGKAKGVAYTQNLINSQVVPSYHQLQLPAVQEYRRLMELHNPAPPRGVADESYQPMPHSFVSFEGFLNAKVLVAVLEKMGPPFERNRLKAAVESLRDLDLGIDAPVSFGPKRHQALDLVYFTVVSEGRFVRLDDWSRWQK